MGKGGNKMIDVNQAIQFLEMLKSLVVTTFLWRKVTISKEVLEDIIQLIKYMEAQNDRKDVRMAEQREKIHGLIK